MPPSVLLAPTGRYYECYDVPTSYPEAVPTPDDMMECPPGKFPQKLLFQPPMLAPRLVPSVRLPNRMSRTRRICGQNYPKILVLRQTHLFTILMKKCTDTM
jgi:hypothetical protein